MVHLPTKPMKKDKNTFTSRLALGFFKNYFEHMDNCHNHPRLVGKLSFSQVTALSLATLALHMRRGGEFATWIMAGLAKFPPSVVHEHLLQNQLRELAENIKY